MFLFMCVCIQGFRGGAVVKNLPANAWDARDAGAVPGLGRSSGIGSGNPLPYSCLENPVDRGAQRATVHSVKKSQTWLSDWACMPVCVYIYFNILRRLLWSPKVLWNYRIFDSNENASGLVLYTNVYDSFIHNHQMLEQPNNFQPVKRSAECSIAILWTATQ